MTNLEYLEMLKREENTWLENRTDNMHDRFVYRKTKALEIIAEELCKFNLTANVLSSVIEAVTNQGRSINVDGRITDEY